MLFYPSIVQCVLVRTRILQNHSMVIKSKKFNTDIILLLIHSPYSNFISCLNHISFMSLLFLFRGHPLHLVVTLIWVNSLGSLCVSWTWHFWRVRASYLVEWCCSNFVLLFPHGWFQVMHFWQDHHEGWHCVFLWLSHGEAPSVQFPSC